MRIYGRTVLLVAFALACESPAPVLQVSLRPY
jgi:hypothetical protein